MAQHRPTGSETPPYAPRSSRFGSEPPSVEDDVDVWRYAIVSCMPETTTTTLLPSILLSSSMTQPGGPEEKFYASPMLSWTKSQPYRAVKRFNRRCDQNWTSDTPRQPFREDNVESHTRRWNVSLLYLTTAFRQNKTMKLLTTLNTTQNQYMPIYINKMLLFLHHPFVPDCIVITRNMIHYGVRNAT